VKPCQETKTPPHATHSPAPRGADAPGHRFRDFARQAATSGTVYMRA